MEFKVRKIDISTGDTLVALLNIYDATKFEIRNQDRIKISNEKGKIIYALVDITYDNKLVPKGHIGLFYEVLKGLNSKSGNTIKLRIEKKPDSIRIIREKLLGKKLNYEEYKQIISDISERRLTDIEMTYFVAGCFVNKLTSKETLYLTQAMINTGEVLHFKDNIVMDKHCIGGIAGNRTTALVVAIIAAAGFKMPKTSSRAITSAAGTADTIETLCNVKLEADKLQNIVETTGGCLAWGGALNLAPADDKIIRVESPISLDPVGQLVASVLAKKKSVSATHVVIDIPVGHGAKIKDEKASKKLKKVFQKIGKMLKMKLKVIITDGSSPIGNGIGPILEARDILYTLKNDMYGSFELKEKSILISGVMLKMAGVKNGEKLARELMDSGKAYNKFIEIIKAQGGKEIEPEDLRVGKYSFEYKSPKSGHIKHINNKTVNRICRVAGAPLDKRAGLYIHAKKGKFVKEGDLLYTVYSESKERLDFAKDIIYTHNGYDIN